MKLRIRKALYLNNQKKTKMELFKIFIEKGLKETKSSSQPKKKVEINIF